MAKDIITRFKLETTQYDSKLRDAAKELTNFTKTATQAGKGFNEFTRGQVEAARALGNTASGATNLKDKLKDTVTAFNSVAKAYNQLTDAQKQSDFGRAMSESLNKLQQTIRETKQQLQGMGSALPQGGGGLFGGGKLDGMLQVFGGNLMTKGAGMLAGLASEMGDMIKQGIELAKQGEGIRIAFERLGRGDLLDGLRQATHGTVTDLELMKAAVKFNDFKLPVEELGTMLAFAQQKAKDTGQSVDYMVDSIVTGLGRKSLLILDNLGLSAAEIKERMAETGDMTKAVGAIIRDQMAKAGDYVETAADRATKANVELENAMTRLGETFQPLSDTANSAWTSIKVGALDLLNNAIKPLINALTEAGRARALYENQGGDKRVNRQLDRLKGIQTDTYRRGTYKAQLSKYNEQIASHEQYLRDYKAWQSDKTNVGAYNRMQAFKQNTGLEWVSDVQAHLDAFKKMRAEYVQGAKSILSPAKANIDTADAEQNVTSLTKKLKELQEQRKKAIEAGDTDLSKNLQKQINQVKADIKGLGGSTTTTTTTHQTPQQRAQESFTKAEQNYKQALEQAAMELKAGTINTAQAKQKEMQAAEARWKAIGDARNIADNPKLQQAQAEAAANYQQLAAEVKTATERQKAIDKATRDLENANQKLTDARSEMAAAEKSGDRKAYYVAEKKATTAQQEVTRLETIKVNVEQGRVELPSVPTEDKTIRVNIEATTSNLDAEIANMKDKMSQLAVGSDAFNMDLAKMVDFTTLRTLINEKVKNGLTIDPEASANLMNQIINGENITDETWQKIIDEINAKLKELDIEPIKIDFKTGESAKTGKETEKAWKGAASAVQSVGSALQGLEDPGAKIAGTIGQAIASIALGFATATSSSAGGGIFAWIAAITGGLATMVSTISAIHSATGYAQGGIVEGNTYSGDQIPANGGTIGLNAGELILNKAQQGNLASQMRDGGLQGLYLEASVHAEQIRLALNNNGKRTGRGELVTWKRS